MTKTSADKDADETTCMCGSPMDAHDIGSGHTPVSIADYYGRAPEPRPAPDAVKALKDIVEFCDDPDGSEKPETLAMGLARLLPAARAALAAPHEAPQPDAVRTALIRSREAMQRVLPQAHGAIPVSMLEDAIERATAALAAPQPFPDTVKKALEHPNWTQVWKILNTYAEGGDRTDPNSVLGNLYPLLAEIHGAALSALAVPQSNAVKNSTKK